MVLNIRQRPRNTYAETVPVSLHYEVMNITTCIWNFNRRYFEQTKAKINKNAILLDLYNTICISRSSYFNTTIDVLHSIIKTNRLCTLGSIMDNDGVIFYYLRQLTLLSTLSFNAFSKEKWRSHSISVILDEKPSLCFFWMGRAISLLTCQVN